MAVLKTDRERRMTGDRVENRHGYFVSIHPAVGEVHGKFVVVHHHLQKLLELRTKEQVEADTARDARDEAALKAAGIYAWAYNQVPGMLAPSWQNAPDPQTVATTQETLFPLGMPSRVAVSHQLVQDSLTEFLNAAARVHTVTFPAEFLQAATVANQALRAAMAKVIKENDEATAATDAVQQQRDAWDLHYAALKDVTTGFLRLQGKLDQLPTLFQDLPPNAAAGAPEPARPAPEPVNPS